jgi:hypothetical protein
MPVGGPQRTASGGRGPCVPTRLPARNRLCCCHVRRPRHAARFDPCAFPAAADLLAGLPHMRIAVVACARTYAQLCITFHDSAGALTSQRQLLHKVSPGHIEPDRRFRTANGYLARVRDSMQIRRLWQVMAWARAQAVTVGVPAAASAEFAVELGVRRSIPPAGQAAIAQLNPVRDLPAAPGAGQPGPRPMRERRRPVTSVTAAA